ncbi:ankyrin repeat domain-containing protein [Polaromonas sp. A23]|uniref:ankyrin repeat domain-containing protein n=1 Tax=Polaromonas sp. A23 TaxID=1944133 RepID=UPI000985B805|nr:ankyrin repeat domain-containing protein [Polaromonas sp. A23]OOG39861.1 hypothetical protein B0B52_14675 [Polaromonas sp. A23]
MNVVAVVRCVAGALLFAGCTATAIAGPNRARLYLDVWFAPHSTVLTSEIDTRARHFACMTSGSKAEITGFIVGYAHPDEGGKALALARAEMVRRRLQDHIGIEVQIFIEGKVDDQQRQQASLRSTARAEVEVQAIFPMSGNFVVERPGRACPAPPWPDLVHEWLASPDHATAAARYERIATQAPHKRAEALIAAYRKDRPDLLDLVLTRSEMTALTNVDRGQLLAAAVGRNDASRLERLVRLGSGPSRVSGDVLKVAVCAENSALIARLLVHGFGGSANTSDLLGAWRCAMRSPSESALSQLLRARVSYPKGQFVDPPLFANPKRIDRIERLVAAGVPGGTVDDQYRTLFHYVALDSPETVSRLVRLGAPVNRKSVQSFLCTQPALPVAASYAPVDVMEALLAAGASLTHAAETTQGPCSSAYRRTVLSYALRCDHKSAVDFLWGREPVNFMQNSDGHTHLHELAYDGYEAARYVKSLVDAGVPVDSRDAYGSTPLLIAVANRSDRMVEELLKYGADPRQRLNDKGRRRYGGHDLDTLMEFAMQIAKNPQYSGAASGSCYIDKAKARLDSDERRLARQAAPAKIVALLQAAIKEGRP